MHTFRDAFGEIVTRQSADGTIDDFSALTASIAHEVSQPPSGILHNTTACLLMPAANPPEGDAPREVIALAWHDLQRQSIVVHAELAADLPTVTGDRRQHRQLVLNLPRNGCDAMSGVDDRPRQLGTPESVGNERQS